MKEFIFLLTISVLVAVPFSLMFELPFMNLERIYLSPKRQRVSVTAPGGAEVGLVSMEPITIQPNKSQWSDTSCSNHQCLQLGKTKIVKNQDPTCCFETYFIIVIAIDRIHQIRQIHQIHQLRQLRQIRQIRQIHQIQGLFMWHTINYGRMFFLTPLWFGIKLGRLA